MSTPRPRSVTLGCVYGGLGGALTAVMLFETLQGWGSIEMQEALRSSLDQVGADIDLDGVLPALRWVVMGLLVAAIAAAVFAVYAAKGHQASRIGLSVLAGLAGVTFLLTGIVGILPALLAALIVYLLWSAPAREWFAVMNGRTPVALGAEPSFGAGPPPAAPAAGAPVAPHRQDAQEASIPLPPPYDPAQHPQHATAAPAAGRPRSVTLALVLSGVAHAIGAVLCGLVSLVLIGARDEVVDQYERSELLRNQLDQAGLTAEQMVTAGAWLFGAWTVVSLLGLAATGWAATRRPAGWWALLVVTVVTAGLAAFGMPVGLVWMVGAIAVIVQLSRPEAKAWFRGA
ncbi:hypothetical protein [Aeromicrobium sp. 179-A 4D2 NHS]|uniref:hypothetical protein n=1 Tax=Aeromicrobium sp. 179-A 4D2 NHS TaxID=3142375 RepID=UPI0039A2DFC2